MAYLFLVRAMLLPCPVLGSLSILYFYVVITVAVTVIISGSVPAVYRFSGGRTTDCITSRTHARTHTRTNDLILNEEDDIFVLFYFI